eukprot:15453709-Alexandrium_andersonii.AAC.1
MFSFVLVCGVFALGICPAPLWFAAIVFLPNVAPQAKPHMIRKAEGDDNMQLRTRLTASDKQNLWQ